MAPAPSQRVSSSGWSQLRLVLETVRGRISEEIRSYPTPIPACDAQFNHLLETRDRVSQELARLNEATRQDASPGACRRFLEELLATTDWIRPEDERELRASLSAEAPSASL